MQFEPVLRNEEAVAVLVVGWSDEVDGTGRIAASMRMLAAETAMALERSDLLARLEEVARTDDLTGLLNRRAWEEQLPRELGRSRRNGDPLCVAMLDLDYFKNYNDERGHQAGDRLLKQSAAAWVNELRASDTLARYGGEEFTVALPGCTLANAKDIVERLRAAMPSGQTVSAGVACWNGRESAEELVGRAAALYEAKRSGRDRRNRRWDASGRAALDQLLGPFVLRCFTFGAFPGAGASRSTCSSAGGNRGQQRSSGAPRGAPSASSGLSTAN